MEPITDYNETGENAGDKPAVDDMLEALVSEEMESDELREKGSRDTKKGGTAAREIFDWVELLAIATAAVIILFTFFLRVAVVVGPSMQNTLIANDVILLSNLFYEPEQGDIIVFQSKLSDEYEPIVKRVIATENQTVSIDYETWTVTVDGVELKEDYVKRDTLADMLHSNYLEFPYRVPEGKIFVMGDNRNSSMDSRDSHIGCVDKRFVLGKLLCRVYPFSKIGEVQ